MRETPFRVGKELNIKKLVTSILAVAAALGLTAVAFADTISVSTGEAALELGGGILPWALVAVLVVVTVLLLRKFRKK